MTDHPVLIPTSEGPVGGIVSEPSHPARAAVVLLPNYGRPARSGINSFWTRMARSLAELGLVVLRMDYSREGETLPIGENVRGQVPTRTLDRELVRQAMAWFRARLDGLDLMLAGSCTGGRGVIDYAGYAPEEIVRTFLLVPHLRALGGDGGEDERADDAVGPDVVECLRATLDHAPSWMLLGEHDNQDVALLRRRLGPTAHELEVEVVPDVALHNLDQPNLQTEAGSRLTARIAEALALSVPPG